MIRRKHLLSISDLSRDEINYVVEEAIHLREYTSGSPLKHQVLALLFEKPSLRTKVSFSVAMYQLGGECIFLPKEEIGIGTREDPSDIAQVLSRYVNGIVYRTFSHQTLEQMAEHASIPVINGLSDLEHPCQALADVLTIYEKKGKLKGVKIAYIGDGNNVAHSLALAAVSLGMDFVISNPPGYGMNPSIVTKVERLSRESGGNIFMEEDPFKAVKHADVVYTDVWTSMGQEAESQKRRRDFSGYQVNAALMNAAPSEALLMHPLPAHYGEEIQKEVLHGPQSVVVDQAENRLHAQKAVLLHLLSDGNKAFPG